ncbi:MAG: hypothetical protein MZV63_29675 [Marinilabiliales bacterium]|nr:hypothetical protein [Marinilabiliales bacterium]
MVLVQHAGKHVGKERIGAEGIEEARPSPEIPYIYNHEEQRQYHHPDTSGIENIGAGPDGFVDREELAPDQTGPDEQSA